MSRVKLVLAYDGSGYRGSQIQAAVPTIQGELERGLRTIHAFRRSVAFAGRTDAGVHAVGQVVSADVCWVRGAERLRSALNSVTPSDIEIFSAEFVEDGFHARFDARFREYRYRVASGRRGFSPMTRRYVWTIPDEIDHGLAARAACLFTGRHGFGSFASSGKSRTITASELEREVYVCEWRAIRDDLFADDGAAPIHELRIVSSGFLPQMARNMVRAVVDVATGKKTLDWIEYLLVSGDRRLLGMPAPPHGLVLWRVGYADDPATATGSLG